MGFVTTPMGLRSTTHVLAVEAITPRPAITFCLRFSDSRGQSSYRTGPWSKSLSAAKERARMIIRDGIVARRNL